MKDLTHYSLLAEIFRYPSSDLKAHFGQWKEIIECYDNGLMSKLEPFIAFVNERPLSFLQEYFTGTFDVQPVSTLDVGYVLFGEDYRRGLFLVNIKKEQIRAGNDCGTELPDHLPNILTLLSKLQDEELAEELIYSLLIPAVQKMISRFRDGINLYRGLLEILLAIMEQDYPSSVYEKFDSGSLAKDDVSGSACNV